MILNFSGGMPLVKGSVIIKSVVKMCSMTNTLYLTLSPMAKYLMSMCLFRLPFLLFLAIKIEAELSQKIFRDLEMESIILSPDIKLLSHSGSIKEQQDQ
jgi:hypothetical protein